MSANRPMENVYLGTWQFDGTSVENARNLVKTAKDQGITHFDTAAVYAGGEAERILGETTDENDHIVTKIPAINRNPVSFLQAYPEGYVAQSFEASVRRLGRLPSTVLLHNWQPAWELDNTTPQAIDMMRRELTGHDSLEFGISLPNGYNGQLEAHSSLFDTMGVIELPFNTDSPELTLDRIAALAVSRRILVRSILKKGVDTANIADKMNAVLDTNAQLVIGASNPSQIEQWKEYIQ